MFFMLQGYKLFYVLEQFILDRFIVEVECIYIKSRCVFELLVIFYNDVFEFNLVVR